MSKDKIARPRDLKLLSIVIPVFNEAQVLPKLQVRLGSVRTEVPCESEIVFVNDGSSDDSGAILLRWAAQDRSVKVIELSRNFGHQAAITAGVDHAQGDAVILMDADLQDPPELIGEMVGKYRQGFDIVHATRVKRHGETLLKRASASLFYWIMSKFIHRDLPQNAGDFRLMSSEAASALRSLRETHRFLRGMVTWVGFRQTSLQFEREPRAAGETKFPARKMVGLALDAVFSFSSAPLRVSTYLGCAVLVFGMVYSGYTVARYFIYNDLVPGWATLVILQSAIGGAILISLGMMGEYIGRIYDEIKRRPLYIVGRTTNISSKRGNSTE
ncbi:MAG TPA: glycosyltransferase family 2 protein [Bdellovibrionota bacterium]|nr:glycosyltransferase family 2 protein [Bdellovibrionota bacterium]